MPRAGGTEERVVLSGPLPSLRAGIVKKAARGEGTTGDNRRVTQAERRGKGHSFSLHPPTCLVALIGQAQLESSGKREKRKKCNLQGSACPLNTHTLQSGAEEGQGINPRAIGK